MNVTIPADVREPYGAYNWFGAVLTMVVVTFCVYLAVVRLWWIQSKKRRRKDL